MHRKKRRLTDLLGIAGLILTIVASGALFPGSSVVSASDTAVIAGAGMGTGDTAADGEIDGGNDAVMPLVESLVAGPTVTESTPSTPTPSSTSIAADPTSTAVVTSPSQQQPVIPPIEPSTVTHVRIASIGVDAAVLPVDSHPTGKTNAWGGPIYRTIEFPVDVNVRQWVRRGDPNTLTAAESAGNVQAFDRVMLYGHASDIGNHLVFQDLSAVQPGDSVIVTTALGQFTYHATTVMTRAKTNLDNLAELYDYPANGAKEIALVACLPDTTNNVVVLGTLASATPIGGSDVAPATTSAAALSPMGAE